MCNIVIPHRNLKNNPCVCKLLLSILGPHINKRKLKKREEKEKEKMKKQMLEEKKIY
jgi:hypothetical protein